MTCDGVSNCLLEPDPILNATNLTNLTEVVKPAEPEPVPEQALSAVSFLKILASVVLSTPLNQATGLRSAYLFAEDLWLYSYDKV